MRNLKTVVVAGVVGLVVGIAGMLMATERVGARQITQPSRLRFTYVTRTGADPGDRERNPGAPPLVYIKDLPTGACWLGTEDSRGGLATLAVAPAQACSF